MLVGGLGFVGYHLINALLDSGAEPIVLAKRDTIRRKKHLYDAVTRLGVDVASLDPRELARVIIDINPEVIYHLAGKPGGPMKIQSQAHVELLRHEIEASKATGSRIVFFSSIAVAADVADQPPGSTVTEDKAPPTTNADFKTIHSETKALGETLLLDSGVEKWSILRPGLIYGPNAPHLEWRLIRAFIFSRIKPVIDNVPVVNVVDVADIAVQSGEGRFDGKWLHVVADTIEFSDVADGLCKSRNRTRCMELPLTWLMGLGSIAPRSSPLRLSWSIISRGYKYRSIHLSGYEWRLQPLL